MAYLQFSLLHIPAVIVHSDSLRLEEYGRWHTPAHILGGWRWKLGRAAAGTHNIHEAPEQAARTGKPPEQQEPQPSPPTQLRLF